MIKRILSEEIVKGSLVLFVTLNIFNFLNYFFHFITARLLSTAQYGVLATLMAIIYIMTVPNESIQTIVAKYASGIHSNKEYGKLQELFSKSFSKGIKISLLLFLIYLALSPLLSLILDIQLYLIIITGFSIFAVFLLPIGRGILQGTKKFYSLGWNYIIEGLTKVILAFLLIYIGLSVTGAISSVIIASFIAFIFSIASFSYIYKYKKELFKIDGIYNYSLNVFLLIATIMILLSMDILVAKAFFSDDVVGKYAVASVIGKMIFFATLSISKSMFPLTAEKANQPKDSFKLLIKSIILTLAISFIALAVFLLFPKIFISILFSDKYLEISGFIFFTGLAFTLLSISNLLLIYFLSQNKNIPYKKIIPFSIIVLIIQFILLYLFSYSINSYVLALVFSNIVIFIITLFFTRK